MPDINNDDFADNYTDTSAPFGTIAPGGSATGTIESQGDVDWFAVQLEPGFKYTIKKIGAATSGSILYLGLDLHDSSGNALDPVASDSTGSGIYGVLTSGTYYISAKSNSSSDTGPYSFQVSAGEAYAGIVNLKNIAGREGDSGSKSAVFEITRTGGTAAFDVSYATRDITATAGSDYLATSGVLHFSDGQTSKFITVQVLGDTTPEPYEQFVLEFTNPTNGAIFPLGRSDVPIFLPGQLPTPGVIGLIQDDDSADDYANALNDTYAPLGHLTVGTPVSGSLELDGDRDTFAISLQAGQSYQIILDGAGSGWGTISLPVTSLYNASHSTEVKHLFYLGDFFYFTAPSTETFYITAASEDSFHGTGSYRLNVIDAPAFGASIAISDVSILEGNSGITTALFTVTRTGTLSAFDVDVITSPYKADATDLRTGSRTLHFAEGVTALTVPVEIFGDTTVENDESFFVTLLNATNGAQITKSTGLAKL